MKRTSFVKALVFSVVMMSSGVCAKAEVTAHDISVGTGHPRIMLLKGEEEQLKKKINEDGILLEAHESILEQSDNMLAAAPLERIKIGKRLLAVSRKAFQNIYFLSYSYRMTGDEKYAAKAREVMLNVCAFSDWNPSHFLDVAEMTAGVAIGYDWLFDYLGDEDKAFIRKAIVEKGIHVSMPEFNPEEKDYSWLNKNNNWNAVCNMGMAWGALAIYEDEPELAKTIIARSIESAKTHTLLEYGPDGNYPEGYMYWSYGTGFLAMLADAVEKATGKDWGFASDYALMRSGEYMMHMTTQNFECFSYSDCNVKENKLAIPLFWIARQRRDNSLLYGEIDRINYLHSLGRTSQLYTMRYVPSFMIWAPENFSQGVKKPAERIFVGQGVTPVAILRNHWGGDDEIFAGLKCGSCSSGHSHMDIGSFVMYKGGNQWFKDLGHQDYNSLEKEGITLNDRSQYSSRWQAFRLSMYSHNLMIFADSLQRVKGYAKIESWGDKPGMVYATTDLTSVQTPLVRSYKRGLAIVDDAYVVVRDEVVGSSSGELPFRWAAVTGAAVTILSDNSAMLEMNGEKLLFKVEGKDVKLETYSTEPPHYYDIPNPGTVMIGWKSTLGKGEKRTYTVSMIPQGKSGIVEKKLKSINKW